ncbi:MAG: hypothetical protein HYU64_13635 [Armatimonadetes bacterium]|nr:hypothetical protein [Armatimonadota bacterium]
MAFTFIGVCVILILAIVGYIRGALRILAAFLALALAGILAKPFSFLTLWLVKAMKLFPLVLQQPLAMVTAGLLLFAVVTLVLEHPIKKREEQRKAGGLPVRTRWELMGGAALGALWGTCLVLLVATGIELVASVDQTVQDARKPVAAKTSDGAGLPVATEQVQEKRVVKEQPAVAGPFVSLREELHHSLFGSAAERLNPVDKKALAVLARLTIVTSDPVLTERLQNHPAIVRLISEPKLRALVRDPEIQQAIQAQQFELLLNNPKIAELLNDKDLMQKFKGLDIEAILRETTSRRP